MLAARELGHEYCAMTDHSPRLSRQRLSPERLRKQLDVIDELRETVAPMRILTGIEVDILEDGSLDQEHELLERLDVVVASVHSKLSMDAPSMTRRMIKAVANPHADVLATAPAGWSPAVAASGPSRNSTRRRCSPPAATTAPRSRSTRGPERRDPPTRLLNLALEIGCLFSIDTDSHAPGQLEFLGYGAQRALDARCPSSGSSTPGRPRSCWSGRLVLDRAGAASPGRGRGPAARRG